MLDLFAGTGALGLEALSRGAAEAVFVDDGRVSTGLIRKNIAICRAEDRCTLARRDALKLGQNPDAPYDLIFLDPPYGKGWERRRWRQPRQAAGWRMMRWWSGEENTPMAAPEGFELHDSRKYGDTHITLMWRDVSG